MIHFRDDDYSTAFTIRQAGGVCLGLTIGLSLLLLQHTYFICTSSSSIEYGVLIPINPFFQGERRVEQEMYDDHKRKLDAQSTLDVEQYPYNGHGRPITNLRANVEIQQTGGSMMAFICSTKCIRMQCQFSRENFFQVFERGKILSWLLPLGIKNESHNGYEWSLKKYTDGIKINATDWSSGERAQSTDESNNRLMSDVQ